MSIRRSDLEQQVGSNFEEIASESDRHATRVLRSLGISTAALPFILNLPSLGFANQQRRSSGWSSCSAPTACNKIVLALRSRRNAQSSWSLLPLEPFEKQTLVLKGISDKVRGDGDSHMRGIGCLLTGVELFPGNVQGGGTRLLVGPVEYRSIRRSRGLCRRDRQRDAIWLSGVWRSSARSRRHLDAHGLCRPQQAAGANRQSLSDAQQTLWPGERSRKPEEHPR